MGYYPRVRSKRMQGDIRSWPEVDGNVRIQAFAGYKVGMTHVEMTDYRKFSTTAGQTIAAPVTVVEVPPLTVAGIRYYDETELGLSIVSEKWAENQDKEIFRRITKQTEKKDPPMVTEVSEVRFIVHTNLREDEIEAFIDYLPEINVAVQDVNMDKIINNAIEIAVGIRMKTLDILHISASMMLEADTFVTFDSEFKAKENEIANFGLRINPG